MSCTNIYKMNSGEEIKVSQREISDLLKKFGLMSYKDVAAVCAEFGGNVHEVGNEQQTVSVSES